MKDKLKEQFKDLIVMKITDDIGAWWMRNNHRLTTKDIVEKIIESWEEEKKRNRELGIE